MPPPAAPALRPPLLRHLLITLPLSAASATVLPESATRDFHDQAPQVAALSQIRLPHPESVQDNHQTRHQNPVPPLPARHLLRKSVVNLPHQGAKTYPAFRLPAAPPMPQTCSGSEEPEEPAPPEILSHPIPKRPDERPLYSNAQPLTALPTDLPATLKSRHHAALLSTDWRDSSEADCADAHSGSDAPPDRPVYPDQPARH